MVDADILKNVVLHSVATAFASIVFPVPGGPYNRIPFHGVSIPVNNWGYCGKMKNISNAYCIKAAGRVGGQEYNVGSFYGVGNGVYKFFWCFENMKEVESFRIKCSSLL